jgi:Xaa-Pro aminopeptidase
VFVEDVVLVTEDGVEVLTAGLARTPDELESMIR